MAEQLEKNIFKLSYLCKICLFVNIFFTFFYAIQFFANDEQDRQTILYIYLLLFYRNYFKFYLKNNKIEM